MIDIHFKISGPRVPFDCAYSLFAALCRHWPDLHERQDVGIWPLHGKFNAPARDLLPTKLIIRVHETDLQQCKDLCERVINIEGVNLLIDRISEIKPLIPAESVYSRLVVVKNRGTSDLMLEYMGDQLARMGITGTPALVPRKGPLNGKDPFVRRTLNIKGVNVVGYAATVSGLSPTDSLRLQNEGIGGRRHFGCGLFVG